MVLGTAALLCVGKLSEPFLRDGCAEYEKRLGRYLKLSVAEVRDRPDAIPDGRALEEEALALTRLIRPEDHVTALAIGGKAMDSVAFADCLAGTARSGKRAVFVIGGSRGLGAAALARADARLSLSPMTFPHGLARLLVLEQIYRACRILSGEAYHK